MTLDRLDNKGAQPEVVGGPQSAQVSHWAKRKVKATMVVTRAFSFLIPLRALSSGFLRVARHTPEAIDITPH
jgi:hypothetical protein